MNLMFLSWYLIVWLNFNLFKNINIYVEVDEISFKFVDKLYKYIKNIVNCSYEYKIV